VLKKYLKRKMSDLTNKCVCKVNTANDKLQTNDQFDKSFVSNLKASEVKCPQCKENLREEIEQSLVEVPTDVIKQENAKKEIMCETHNLTIIFWCKTCKDITCCKCLVELHNKHDIKSIDEAVEDMKDCISNDEEFLRDAKLEIEKANDAKSKLETVIGRMAKFEKQVKQLIKDIEARKEKLERNVCEREACVTKATQYQSNEIEVKKMVSAFKKWKHLNISYKSISIEPSMPEGSNQILSRIISTYQVRLKMRVLQF